MGRRAVLASTNAHKLAELSAALPDWQIELLEGAEFPPEDGASYHENALGKARFGLTLAPEGVWVLGEDAGVEVDALGGRPGLHSARWAADGVAALLAELEGVETRRARYRCELVALSPEGEERHGSGILEGSIAVGPRGNEGFGYDPIFIPDGERKTVAELGNAWKSRKSARAQAARALRS